MIDFKYVIRIKDGTTVGRFQTLQEANMAVDLFEEIDKDAGLYEPDSYEIYKKIVNKPKGSVYITI